MLFSPDPLGGEMKFRSYGAMDWPTALLWLVLGLTGYAAWLTSIVFCSTNNLWPLLVAGGLFFPVGVVHGVGLWFGGW